MRPLFAAALLFSAAPSYAADDGFKDLFDGKSLVGWDGNPAFWSVQEGAIVGQTTKENPTKGNTFLIWRQGDVDDFELVAEYKMIGGNSGIQYRSRELGQWVIGGYQADFEAGTTYSGINYEERGRGILALRGQRTTLKPGAKPEVAEQFADTKDLQAKIKHEDWNTYRVVAKGNQLEHSINGTLMSAVTDQDPEKALRSGLLALQLHAGPPMKVMFRSVRMKRLPLAGQRKVVFVAGRPSHARGDHEHNAGCKLLADSLAKAHPGVATAVYRNGWPSDPTAFDNANAVVMFCDGGTGHYVLGHLDETDRLMKRGVGLACLHYAVEVPKEKAGAQFLDWIGGYFEMFWSVNPHWTAKFAALPDHEICRGVQPFEINDEWYYHMRFRDGLRGVTPILSAVPPESTRQGKVGPHSGNEHVAARRGQAEVVAWAAERDGGGRGFGFTGAHYHRNWGNDNFRKLALNAIAWVAHAEIPAAGIATPTPSKAALEAGLDDKSSGK